MRQTMEMFPRSITAAQNQRVEVEVVAGPRRARVLVGPAGGYYVSRTTLASSDPRAQRRIRVGSGCQVGACRQVLMVLRFI